jgi:hypothetical protein
MGINVLARKLLWGRAGNRCAYPGCLQALTIDLGTEDSKLLSAVGVVMGEEAHIRSSSKGGPRYDGGYSMDKVDTYENLILLCPTHHTLIDKNNGSGFSVLCLEEMKRAHEGWVTERLGVDGESERELSERMLALLLIWEQKMHLGEWQALTSQLNQPIPRLLDCTYGWLIEAGSWLLGMTWSKEFPRTGRAFRNLRRVLGDLLNHVQRCMVIEDGDAWELRREYKQIGWDPVAYRRLFAKFQVERFGLYVLVIEATKAVNWVISEAIVEVDRFCRFDQGVVLMRDGDGVFRNYVVRLEYEECEVLGNLEMPYPGMESIVKYMESKISEDDQYFENCDLESVTREARGYS